MDKCGRCGKEIVEEKSYTHRNLRLCEDCYIHTNLFPLKHTGHYGKLFYIKDNK